MDRRSFFAGAATAIATCGISTPLAIVEGPYVNFVSWEEVASSNPAIKLFRMTVETNI